MDTSSNQWEPLEKDSAHASLALTEDPTDYTDYTMDQSGRDGSFKSASPLALYSSESPLA